MEDVDQEDCGESSGDEEGRERFRDSVPSKRPVEEEWSECAVAIDAREAAGVANRRAGLTCGLEGSEPVLTFFQ